MRHASEGAGGTVTCCLSEATGPVGDQFSATKPLGSLYLRSSFLRGVMGGGGWHKGGMFARGAPGALPFY